MEISNIAIKAHLFMCTSCTYKKPDLTESTPDDAYNLRKAVKSQAYERFGKQNVRVSAVKCLGECEHGIATVLYPSGEWNLGVRPEDADILLQKIEQLTTN